MRYAPRDGLVSSLPPLRYAVALASMLWLLSGAGGFAMSRLLRAVTTASSVHSAVGVPDPPRAARPAPVRISVPPWHRLLRLFLARNLAVTMVLLSGLVTLGLSALVLGAANGWSLGMTIGSAIGAGASPRALAFLLLPHGVFELTGLILACAVGLNGATIGWRLVREVPVTIAEVRARYGGVARVAVALIVLAAVVECSITPLLGGAL